MKKFSKITNVSVNSQPKAPENVKDNDLSTLKYAVHKLIKEFLSIRIEGPIDPILQGTIRMSGEEEFIESVINLFKTKEVSDTLKLLQEAKFNGLDNIISHYEDVLLEKQTQGELKKHDSRISDIIRKSDGDHDEAIKLAQRQADRINSGEKSFYRGLAAERMIGSEGVSKKTMREISDIFIHRSKQLGYRK